MVDEHFLPALEEFDLDFEDLADILGEQAPWTLWGCAFEDFLARRWGPDGQTIVDAYFKRRGWSEKVLNRAYIEGLRDAHVSLLEVIDVVSGVSMTLRDLLTGADPVVVQEQSASQSLKQWDWVGGPGGSCARSPPDLGRPVGVFAGCRGASVRRPAGCPTTAQGRDPATDR